MIFSFGYCLALGLVYLMVVANEVTTTKMEQSKELPVTANNVEVPLQITTKNPKKVAAGTKLAEFNSRNKEKLAQEA